VLLAVLLLTTLIASLVMTYSRHALLAVDSSSANLESQRAQAAADSGFAWAKQSLAADAGSATRLDLGDGRSVSVSVGSAAGNLRSIDVDATTEGTSQAVRATFETYAVAGERLPGLTAAAKSAVNAASPVTILSGSSNSYSSTELTGTILMRTGARLTLRDVILDGSIVSEAALTGASGGVTIELRGGVLIQPGATLPGCAIVAPDADIDGDGSEFVQLHGAIIAERLRLRGAGALHGEVACEDEPELAAGIERPGSGRAPRAWPAALETHSASVGRLAFRGVDVRDAERTAIRGFTFPNRRPLAPTGSP
jgi:hypothetical protein